MGKMVIFEAATAPDLDDAGLVVERSFADNGSVEDLWPEAFRDGTVEVSAESRVPFRHDAPDGISLVVLDFSAGYLLPRHSHSADCLYYIVEGGIEMGSRVLGPGDGFFVPSDHPYAYRVGPKGVKLLEFRTRTAFDSKFYEQDLGRYEEKAVASIREYTEKADTIARTRVPSE